MLDCEAEDWGQFLLVQGDVKPAAIVELFSVDTETKEPFNPFSSKFRSMEELEEHMTETGVLFEVVFGGGDHTQYIISKEQSKLDEFSELFGAPSLAEREEMMGTLLGYPEEAVKKYPLKEKNMHVMTESEASYAVMKLRGRGVPAWFHYVWHIPAKGNLVEDFSESSVRLAEKYAAFFQEFHPEYHEWHLRVSEDELETLVSDIKYIVDMWESSAEN